MPPPSTSSAPCLGITRAQTAKAVFYQGGSGALVFAVVRGDLDVNETKLRAAAGEATLTPATADLIRAHGAEPGYGSPIGVRDAKVVVDLSVRDTPNLVAGANKVGFHYRNVNLDRDFAATVVADITVAEAGMPCPVCGTPMRADRAIEVGNIFKLGTRYTEAMGATYLDAEGVARPMVMGCYGIGSGRSAASVVEQRHDARGICWPVSIAPYQLSLLSLGGSDDAETNAAADRVYDELLASGLEVLYDDRADRAGVKFNDADLIGNPLRVSVSKRTLANGQAELKARREAEPTFVPLEDLVPAIRTKLAEIAATERTAPTTR
jgi:prolyl-tRNA synthetase